MITRWPSERTKTFSYRTSHHDIVPTLTQKMCLAAHNSVLDLQGPDVKLSFVAPLCYQQQT